MWTVLKLIEATATLLAERGSPSPRVDAELLLAHVLGHDRTWIYMNARRPVDEEERDRFRALVGRRARGEPVAYLLGTAGFWSLDLLVDERVLVPRPETERLIECTLSELAPFAREDWRIVDVGTGSGAIALALASELPAATVLATDISPAALEVARENAERCGLRDRVKFTHGDLLAPLGGRAGVVDVVVSNPPYIGEGDPELEAAVAAHEPHLALFAGEDGLAIVRRLLRDAHQVLAPGGRLLVEFGARQGDAVRELAAELFPDVRIVRDYAGLDRVLVARKAGELAPLRAAEPDPTESAEGTAPDEADSDAQPVWSEEDADGGTVAERMLAEAEANGLPLIALDDL